MTLTEKEITIEVPGITLELYAEYSNNSLTDIYLTVNIDGQKLKGYGLGVRIYDGLKLTSFYGALMLCLSDEAKNALEKEVKQLINLNEN